MLRKQIGIIPRIAIGCRNRVIGISPITLAPIARYIADASMRGSGSKHIRLSLQIHRHESSIRGTQASDTFIVDKRMGCTEFLRTFNDPSAVRSPHALTWRAENSWPYRWHHWAG